jgi:hypothetical protein
MSAFKGRELEDELVVLGEEELASSTIWFWRVVLHNRAR